VGKRKVTGELAGGVGPSCKRERGNRERMTGALGFKIKIFFPFYAEALK
jgi:hypothetical protein